MNKIRVIRADLILSKRIVRIAVQPTLSWLRRRNHRMTTRARMLRRMLVRRTIATTRRTALLASPQVDPLRTNLHTLFANQFLRLPDLVNRSDMNTYICCHPASIQAGFDNLRVDCDRKNLNRY